ncbi:hypothetical protein ACHAXH_001736 [Discostella pseudostelligera]
MMNSIASFLVLVVAAATLATTSTAFTTTQSRAVLRQSDAASRPSNIAGPTFQVLPSSTSTSTALQLKVKVDPEAKKTKNAAGNAKMAAYGGSVVIALLLPIAFLVWSAVSK